MWDIVMFLDCKRSLPEEGKESLVCLFHCLRAERRVAQPRRSKRHLLSRAPCETQPRWWKDLVSSRQNQQCQLESAPQDWGRWRCKCQTSDWILESVGNAFAVFSLPPSSHSGPVQCIQRCDVHRQVVGACSLHVIHCRLYFIFHHCSL